MAEAGYPRDLRGYGRNPPDPKWPGNARVAVQFVVNFEEGGENNILHGDRASEAFLSDVLGAQPWPGQRHANIELMFEYGSRAGFWRLWRMFTERKLPATVFGVATALEAQSRGGRRHEGGRLGHRQPQPEVGRAQGHVGSRGARGDRRRDPRPHRGDRAAPARLVHRTYVDQYHAAGDGSRRLPLSPANSYADDLPYWIKGPAGPHLIIPYSLDANDMRFVNAQGFGGGEQFFTYLKDSFDVLYAEGETSPKMMSVGLHCRVVGRPGRAAALMRFLDYIDES